MVQCSNCLAINQTPGTNCTVCGRLIPAQSIPSQPTPQTPPSPGKKPNPQYGKRKGGFFSKIGSLGSWFTKGQKKARKSVEEGKKRVVAGTKYAYQRPYTVFTRRLAQISWWIKPLFIVIIITIIALVLLGFNVVQFGWLNTFGGLSFIIGGVFLAFLGLEQLSREKNLGYIWLLLGAVFLIYGLYAYGLFSTSYLYIAIVIVTLYILFKSKLSSKTKLLIVVGLILLGLILFYFGNIFAISNLVSSNLFMWIGAIFLILLGVWLVSKKDSKGKHSYLLFGIILILLPLFLYFLSSFTGLNLSTLFSSGGASLRWLIIGFLAILIIASLAKGQYTWAILFFVIIILVWFFSTESGSLILSNLGVKAQVAGGESFSAKLGKSWNYIKNPEAFFARYGEFGNPNIENKALVGLKIDKFEPLIKEFRSVQDLRFSGEIKHYALPKFSDDKVDTLNIGVSCYIPEEKDSGQTSAPYYADEVIIKPGKTVTNVPENVPSDVRIKNEQLIVEPLKFKNFTKFVTCKFNAGKVPAIKDKETRKAYLNVSYHDFITRSDVYVYLLGQNAYDKIEKNVLEAGGDLDNEFLYELRNAASYPGLIDNERRTISEFSSGPAWLQVSVYDQQPLKSNRNDYTYTLIVKSKPNSVDWIGAINIKDIYLVVPSWFTPGNDCAFSEGSGGVGDTKRLTLKASSGEKKDLLGGCSGEGASCAITCDFTVNSQKNEQNIQEYRISAYQLTDYTITQGTSFEYIKSKAGGVSESDENYMKSLYESTNPDDWKKLLDICDGRAVQGIEQTQIIKYKATKYCTFEMITLLKQKLKGASTNPAESPTITPSAIEQQKTSDLKITSTSPSGILATQGERYFRLTVVTNMEATCRYSENAGDSFGQMLTEFGTNDGMNHSVTEDLGGSYKTQDKKNYYVKCRKTDGTNEQISVISFTVS